ncbi:MAG: N-acyl-D-amino-acid deacylase family protein [Chloroflexota bacterium]
MMLDTVIRGGLLVDGVNPPRTGDVGISGGRIVAVADLEDAEALESIDAGGLAVAPGFIDVHTHGDLLPFSATEPGALELAAIRQGVTTQIVGNCGFSVFAYDNAPQEALHRHVASLLGDTVKVWTSLDRYAQEASANGLFMNVASLVGHGSLRACLLADPNVPSADLGVFSQSHVAEALDQGAVGFSSGLVYAPGVYADSQELITACGALSEYGLPYVTHVRGESDCIADSIAEAIRIATEADVSLHVSHHKVVGARNWGKSEQTLAMLERARERGLDVTLDVYPYTSASTSFHSLLPGWVHENGFLALLDLVRQSDVRARLRREIAEGGDQNWENLLGAAGWDGIRIARLPRAAHWEGLSIAQVADRQSTDPLDTILDLQVFSGQSITLVLDVLSDEDVSRILASPLSMVGSDGIPLPGKPHPRWAGSFARVLGQYTRERCLLDLSTAVKKMSVMPAKRFKLHGRGLLAPGAVADIVVFDPVNINDMATFDRPLEQPTGVEFVLVDGQVTIERGEFTARRAGRFLAPTVEARR